MASDLKSLLVAALLICVAVANPFSQEMDRARDRFCAFTIEQKRAVAGCLVNGYPSVLRDFVLACTPPEDIDGAWTTLVERMSFDCNPEQYAAQRSRFLDCLEEKEKEANYRVTVEDVDEARNVYINCINRDVAES